MFPETQTWQPDGTAQESGWTVPKESRIARLQLPSNEGMWTFGDTVAKASNWSLWCWRTVYSSRCSCRTLAWKNTTRCWRRLTRTCKRTTRNIRSLESLLGWMGKSSQSPTRSLLLVEAQRMSRGSTSKFGVLENKFEGLLMDWFTKYEFKRANTLCKDGEPIRAKTNKLNYGEQDEKQLQKWKIIDYIAVPIRWVTRSTIARNSRTRNLTNHWPVGTYVRLPQKEMWMYKSFSVLKGWRPKTESDETGFGRMILESLEDASDLMDDVSIEDNSQELSNAVSAIKFDYQEKEAALWRIPDNTFRQKGTWEEKVRRNWCWPKESWHSKKEFIGPEESHRKCRESRITNSSVMRFNVQKMVWHRETGNNGRSNWKDIRGRNIRMMMKKKARGEID